MDIENEGLIELAIEGRTFQNGVGWIDLNRDALLQGVENFYNRPVEARDLPIKYGTHEAGTDAAGWIKAMMPTERKGRMVVMALVQWTKQGRKAVKEQLQRFISPEFFETWKNKDTGKNQGFTFTGAALVNDPQLESLRPAFALSQGNTPFAHFFANANMPNQGNNMAKPKIENGTEGELPTNPDTAAPIEPAPIVPDGKTFADTVKEIMTVPAETTEADLIEMLKAKLQLACDYEATKASGAQAVAMSQSAAADADAKAKKLSQTVDEQAAKLQALTQTVKQNDAEKWVDGFMLSATNRRLVPAQRETFVQLYLSDPKAAAAVVDSLPVLAALGQSTGIGGKPAEDGTLDAKRDATYKHALSQNKTPAEAAKLAAAIQE